MKSTHWSTLTILAFIEGLAALVFYFWIPSETGRPGWLGFSPSRWLIGICIFLFLLVLLGWIIFIYSQPAKWENISQKWNGWLDSGSHIWGARVILLTAFGLDYSYSNPSSGLSGFIKNLFIFGQPGKA